MVHTFTETISHIGLPDAFTYPFHYTPHPLCVLAAEEVQTYLSHRKDWKEELKCGKMCGVLIVQNDKKELGFLAAFSGNLAGKNTHPYFVPPVYDLSKPNDFFRTEEKKISALNRQITDLLENPEYQEWIERLAEETKNRDLQLRNAKEVLKKSKAMRDQRRRQKLTAEESAALLRESQHQKAEFKRMEQHWKDRLSILHEKTTRFTDQTGQLKQERKKRSAALQQKLFEAFKVLNARGEIKSLAVLFAETIHKTPPAGAGECAAPKLLQYAYLNRLKPLALAEFWWGNSLETEIRRHRHYYPACKGKCEPILRHMLQGLTVETNPLQNDRHRNTPLQIVFEDDFLVVINKPEGMLSAPGKEDVGSVYQRLKERYPAATGPLIVHRLDMATSGLLLAAKTKKAHQHLQAQFKHRTVKKRYIALLGGISTPDEGIIELPLCPDLLDRPRQMVSLKSGKPASTRYHVLSRTATQTRIAFYPLTGRTHQLRVHAAHPLGLNSPIHGDMLYGHPAERLFLHAEYLEFTHPVSETRLCFEQKAGF